MDLEEISFRNLVNSYRDELLEVLGGGDVTKIFTRASRRTLRRHGVLRRGRNPGVYGGSQIIITDEAQEVLNS